MGTLDRPVRVPVLWPKATPCCEECRPGYGDDVVRSQRLCAAYRRARPARSRCKAWRTSARRSGDLRQRCRSRAKVRCGIRGCSGAHRCTPSPAWCRSSLPSRRSCDYFEVGLDELRGDLRHDRIAKASEEADSVLRDINEGETILGMRVDGFSPSLLCVACQY